MKRLTLFIALSLLCLLEGGAETFTFGTATNPAGSSITVDEYGILMDGKHVIPVMGEMHYSRIPRQEWRREIRKMKAGGITLLSTYVFWSHHEAIEGQWNWSGNLDLHYFMQLCQEEQMPVVLRVGPFCHGEVYQGGFPDWLVQKTRGGYLQDGVSMPAFRLRSEDAPFLSATQRLFSNIYAQVSDMLWKHGGPIVGMQIENESRGPWTYYMKLRNMALQIGFDLPFYTRTGWPQLQGKEEFGLLLPLYGDYADGFWDRSLKDMPGDYAKAFIMKHQQQSATIATETFSKDELKNSGDTESKGHYPYLTCELGGGMMPSYHRRINMSGREAFPLAVCKLGSGSNLPGYYMYHGGSNPYSPLHTMAECQASPVTNYNDMPHISYDFQAPLGEMGMPDAISYHKTRWLHQFLHDWGGELALMPVDTLSDQYARRGCFVFRNTYVRILSEQGVASVTPSAMPWQGLVVTSSSVQPFAKADSMLYFITVPGEKPRLTINGKKYSPRLDRPFTVAGKSLIVLSPERARTAYVIDGRMHYAQHGGILYKDGDNIVEESWQPVGDDVTLTVSPMQGTPKLRTVQMGRQKVAEQPYEADFQDAPTWQISFAAEPHPSILTDQFMTMDLQPSALECPEDYFLEIQYQGDVARLYADGILVQDNFWNGKPMHVRLSSLVGKKVELRILPLGKDYPIYLQKEQRTILDAAPDGILLRLISVRLIKRSPLQLPQ